MHVFITGATGFIGTAVVNELISNGHTVTGLARSDSSAQKLKDMGAKSLKGSLDDLEILQQGAREADGVIHLAFIHDFMNFESSAQIDTAAIDALGTALEGTDKPLVVAAGVAGISPSKVALESDKADANGARQSETAALSFSDRGVRVSVLRLAPSVHGQTDKHGFIPSLISVARDQGVSGYIGDGSNRWSAVNVADAAVLARLALENAEAGTILHAVGEEAIEAKAIAEAIAAGLNVPSRSIDPSQANEHFGWIDVFFSLDMPASSVETQEKFGWKPEHPGLLDDLGQSFYFKN